MYFAGPLAPGVQVHRLQTVVIWAAAIVLTTLVRASVRAWIRRSTPPERVLLVGSGEVAAMVARKLQLHPELSVELVGHVDDSKGPHHAHAGLSWLGRSADIERVCRSEEVERIIVAFSSMSSQSMLEVIRIAKRLRVKVSIVPRMFEVLGQNVEIDQIEGMTLLGLRPLTRTASTRWLKRVIDIAGAAAGLLSAAPLLLAAAAAIKLTSRGPVLFAQPRIGRGNRPFRMLKLRTMVDGADAMKPALAHLNEMGPGMFKIANDPRVTPVGRFLRRTSLDELPQLWNVLRGEMSLVGPRPLVPEEDGNVIGWHRARLDLTPGLTGPWQVMGRNQIPFPEMVKLDYLYVANWSLWNDVKLLLRTLPVVVGRSGA
jgi:exopolysaccharide biosynthesis polyprenyl glycosylphosphotransferase